MQKKWLKMQSYFLFWYSLLMFKFWQNVIFTIILWGFFRIFLHDFSYLVTIRKILGNCRNFPLSVLSYLCYQYLDICTINIIYLFKIYLLFISCHILTIEMSLKFFFLIYMLIIFLILCQIVWKCTIRLLVTCSYCNLSYTYRALNNIFIKLNQIMLYHWNHSLFLMEFEGLSHGYTLDTPWPRTNAPRSVNHCPLLILYFCIVYSV